jgi:hypothetical protein
VGGNTAGTIPAIGSPQPRLRYLTEAGVVSEEASGGGRAVEVRASEAKQGQVAAVEAGRGGGGGVYELLVAEDMRDGSIAGMVRLGFRV